MVSVYKYLSYRGFLRDALADLKKQDRSMTQRKVHRLIGLKESSGFLANVLSGRKKLATEHIDRLAELFGMTEAETKYWHKIATYAHERKDEVRNEQFDQILAQHASRLKRLKKSEDRLFSKWFYVFIRELIAFMRVSDNYKEVAKLIDPPIAPDQVKKALQHLEKIGIIRRNDDGVYKQVSELMTTGDEISSVELARFQFQTMDLAKRALQRIPGAERNISVVSMALSEEGFARANAAVNAFRKQLLAIAAQDSDENRVYHCNIQLFPVTRKKGSTE